MAAEKPSIPDSGFSSTRIEAFSDGVIAIIITLMILEIKIPELHNQSDYGFWGAIQHLMPHVLAYMVSFVMLGIYWVNHHNFFHKIKYGDRKLLWLNLNLLFWMSLIPIPTNIIGDDPLRPASSLIYSIVMFMTSASFTYMGMYANKANLFTGSIPIAIKKQNMRKNLTGLGLYVIAMITAYISVWISFGIFIFIAARFFMPKLGIPGLMGKDTHAAVVPDGKITENKVTDVKVAEAKITEAKDTQKKTK